MLNAPPCCVWLASFITGPQRPWRSAREGVERGGFPWFREATGREVARAVCCEPTAFPPAPSNATQRVQRGPTWAAPATACLALSTRPWHTLRSRVDKLCYPFGSSSSCLIARPGMHSGSKKLAGKAPQETGEQPPTCPSCAPSSLLAFWLALGDAPGDSSPPTPTPLPPPLTMAGWAPAQAGGSSSSARLAASSKPCARHSQQQAMCVAGLAYSHRSAQPPGAARTLQTAADQPDADGLPAVPGPRLTPAALSSPRLSAGNRAQGMRLGVSGRRADWRLSTPPSISQAHFRAKPAAAPACSHLLGQGRWSWGTRALRRPTPHRGRHHLWGGAGDEAGWMTLCRRGSTYYVYVRHELRGKCLHVFLTEARVSARAEVVLDVDVDARHP